MTTSFFGQTVQAEITPAGTVPSAQSYPCQSFLTLYVGQTGCTQTQAKPHIAKVRQLWHCRVKGRFGLGLGFTPFEAYADWLGHGRRA